MRMAVRLAVAVALAARLAAAEDVSTTTATAAPAATSTTLANEAEDTGFGSPRSTMRGFLAASDAGDWKTAAEHLDLRRIPKSHRDAMGPLLARQLKTVVDRTLLIDLDALSEDADGDRSDGLPRRDVVGTIRLPGGGVELAVERIAMPDGTLAWRIASSTVAAIPSLYAEYGNGPLEGYLPDYLVETQLLGLRLWQWLALAVLVAGGLLIGWLLTGTVLRVLEILIPEERRGENRRSLVALVPPIRLLIALAVVAAASPWLTLALRAAAVVTLVRKTASIVVVTWLLLRVVDVVLDIAADRLRVHGRAGAISVIPLGRRTMKIFVGVMAAIAIVQNLGYNATGILAGLGIGGLAVALAAQRTVENLLGGVMLITDQPVRVGDLCRFGTRIGTVEDIGLRSTRIRTPERSIVSVPNAEFASTQIENLDLRDRRLLTLTIALRADTGTAALRHALEAMRAVLDAEQTIERNTSSVRLAGMELTSFNVELSAYVLTRSDAAFLATREKLLFAILDALDAAGTALAGRKAPTAAASEPSKG